MVLARNMALALLLLVLSHIALHPITYETGHHISDHQKAMAVAVPRAKAAHDVAATKVTMPLDGLQEMFEYAKSGEEWGETSIIMPPRTDSVIAGTSPRSETGPPTLAAATDQHGMVAAFDGWHGAASFP